VPRVRVPADSTLRHHEAAQVTARLLIHPIGTLRSRTGNGLGYVNVGHRDCARHRTILRFSSAARSRARKVTVFVNGKRRIVLKGRHVRRAVLTVTSIPAASSGALRVVTTLKGGGRRT